jgi:hypothetical protein
MKITIAVACIAATLLIGFISCDWFRSSKEAAFDITGQWKIDSVESKDSSRHIALLASVPALKDSLPVNVQFNADSTFRYPGANDSARYKYYVSDDRKNLFIKEDSVFRQMNIVVENDSSFTIVSPDSVFMHLRRGK